MLLNLPGIYNFEFWVCFFRLSAVRGRRSLEKGKVQ